MVLVLRLSLISIAVVGALFGICGGNSHSQSPTLIPQGYSVEPYSFKRSYLTGLFSAGDCSTEGDPVTVVFTGAATEENVLAGADQYLHWGPDFHSFPFDQSYYVNGCTGETDEVASDALLNPPRYHMRYWSNSNPKAKDVTIATPHYEYLHALPVLGLPVCHSVYGNQEQPPGGYMQAAQFVLTHWSSPSPVHAELWLKDQPMKQCSGEWASNSTGLIYFIKLPK